MFMLIIGVDEDGYKHLFKAPAFAWLEKGDVVYRTIETEHRTYRRHYDVVACENFEEGSAELNFLFSLPGLDEGAEIPKISGYAKPTEYDLREVTL